MNNEEKQALEAEIKAIREGGVDLQSPRAAIYLEAMEYQLEAMKGKPDYFIHRVEVCDSYGPDVELRAYNNSLDASKSKDDHGGEVVEVFITPPASIPAPDGWVKCGVDYPKVGEDVLIRIPVCESFNIESGKYIGDGLFLGAWFDTRGKGKAYDVSHWMPLPAAPVPGGS
ncbi:DUF551 domain-containing protein [Erwinia sp. E_sp_B04_7]|uniref:DUF551 domain-containing protein n=1 Tax=unclassified Erwinia TaxID=2622719 RepID=UPI0030D16881